MYRTIGKAVTAVAAFAAAVAGGYGGVELGAYLQLQPMWGTFLSTLLAGLGVLVVGYAYYRLFLEEELERPEIDEDSVRSYSSFRRR